MHELFYNVEAFQQAGQEVFESLTEYLRNTQDSPTPALPSRSSQDRMNDVRDWLDQGESRPVQNAQELKARVSKLSDEVLHGINRLHSPHYLGHQVPPPIPIAGLMEILGSVPNQPSGIYEMGPITGAMERALIEKLLPFVGWSKDTADGILTHGGSIANLTAILAARNDRVTDSWKKGWPGKRPAILTSSDTHYSVSRAAGILGLGTDQVISLPIDQKRKADPAQFEATIEQARARGLEPFCVIGSACSTSTGSFDPLEAMADFAEKHGLWFHVDGAHGGSLLLSRKYRHLLKGVERADSLTWDAHKMMHVPALSTAVLYRDRVKSFQAFNQDAPYLLDTSDPEKLNFDSAYRTMECTKRPLALALFTAWSLGGPQLFESIIDRTIDQTRRFYERVRDSKDFEAMHDPECNIFCFHFVPESYRSASPAELSALQTQVRKRLLASEQFYITSTVLNGQACLRVTIINPLTEDHHLDHLLKTIRMQFKA